MVLKKTEHDHQTELSVAKKRRIRRKRALAVKNIEKLSKATDNNLDNKQSKCKNLLKSETHPVSLVTSNAEIAGSIGQIDNNTVLTDSKVFTIMSSKENTQPREAVMAAREAKKLAKQSAKSKTKTNPDQNTSTTPSVKQEQPVTVKPKELPLKTSSTKNEKESQPKSKDEVDKAVVTQPGIAVKTKEEIKAERESKKLAKQTKKQAAAAGDATKIVNKETVAETIASIIDVAKEVQNITAKVNTLLLKVKSGQPETEGKSKAELKAERRAKQEAQRAAKAAVQKEPVKVKTEIKPVVAKTPTVKIKENSPKPKVTKTVKSEKSNKMFLFPHLSDNIEDSLNNIPLNSNIHPAITKLGVQLATGVVSGSNASSLALLDALKKMVSEYSAGGRSELARTLGPAVRSAAAWLAALRPPCAALQGALHHFQYHLTHLPNNIDEFQAKKILHEAIDGYIREQIDMSAEAISIAVRQKICDGDYIMTYGFSSVMEAVLVSAAEAGVKYRVVVAGGRTRPAGRELLRRLRARGVRCLYVDLAAVPTVIRHVTKLMVGASELQSDGALCGACGTAPAAVAARARGVPALAAADTQSAAGTAHVDAFGFRLLENPDDYKYEPDSPLKDWRCSKNLCVLRPAFDLTPACLVTAVVTELAIIPCTSAPVLLRLKLASDLGVQ